MDPAARPAAQAGPGIRARLGSPQLRLTRIPLISVVDTVTRPGAARPGGHAARVAAAPYARRSACPTVWRGGYSPQLAMASLGKLVDVHAGDRVGTCDSELESVPRT